MIQVAAAMCLAGANAGTPTTVVDAFVEAYNAHDVKALRGLVSQDARIGHAQETVSGSVAIGNYETIVFPRFPSVNLKVSNRLAVGDLVAQTETLTGFQEPEVGLSVYRVKDGCIVEMSINQ